MAANDVGSLLVYDKDKAGPDGAIPQLVDACVGIITERGMLRTARFAQGICSSCLCRKIS